MFKQEDGGMWEFRPDGATVIWTPEKDQIAARSVCHTLMGLALIEYELRRAPTSLWVIQIYAAQDVQHGKPSRSDPLGQHTGPSVPLVSVFFSRRPDDIARFLVQHADQYTELSSATAVMEQLKTTITRWMIEGLA